MKPTYFIYTKAFSDFSSRMQFIGLSSALLMSPYPELYLTLFFIGRQVGGMMISYLAGIVADRYSKHRTMIFSELASAGIVLSLIFLKHPLFIVMIAFLLGITYVFFDVSYRASIPSMFGEENLTKINTLLVRLGAIMSIIGFTAGGFISAFFSYKYLLVFDGIMYIVSAIVLLKVQWVEPTLILRSTEQKQINQKIIQTNEYLFLLIVGFVYPLAASAYQYALPLFTSVKENGDLYNGLMWSTIAIGSFLCSLFIKKEAVNEQRYIVSLLLFAFFVSMTFIYKLTLFSFFLLLLVGASEAFVQVNHYTLLQCSHENVRGRLLGLNTLATRCGFLFGFLLIPVLSKWTSLTYGIWLMQSALILCCAVYIWQKNKC